MDGYRPKESRNGDALKVVMAEIGKGQGRGGRGRGGWTKIEQYIFYDSE